MVSILLLVLLLQIKKVSKKHRRSKWTVTHERILVCIIILNLKNKQNTKFKGFPLALKNDEWKDGVQKPYK